MKRSKKFIRKFIRNRNEIPGYREQTVKEAQQNVAKILNRTKTLTVSELKQLLPDQFTIMTGSFKRDPGAYLYRARLMGVEDYREAGFWGRSEFWEAPAECIKGWGRLNQPGESVFYLSDFVPQTFQEIRYQTEKNKKYAVVVSAYKVKKPLEITYIGAFGSDITVANIYAHMISDLFSLPAETYGENVYELSNFLSNYYNYIPNNAEGFAFTPILQHDLNVSNIALMPSSAHEYLDYDGSIVVPNYEESLNGNISVEYANDSNFNDLSPAESLNWISEKFGITFSMNK